MTYLAPDNVPVADRAVREAPHSVEAEQALIGSVLTHGEILDRAAAGITTDVFFDPTHQQVWAKLLDIRDAGDEPGLHMIMPWASKHEGLQQIGGASYLVRLAGASIPSSTIPSVCRKLADLHARRDLQQAAARAVDAAASEGEALRDVVAALDDATTPYDPGDGNGWPGEVEALGHVSGVIPDTVWQQIALGGDIVTELEGAGGTIDYLRLLDGTATGLAPPASVPADTTLPMTVDGNPVLRPGSTIRRQSPASYLVPDRIDDGYVWGVLPGATTGTVRLSGIVSGRTGALQARLFYAADGTIVQDWTTIVADVTGLTGAWQGECTAPLMTNGHGHIGLRTTGEPDDIAHIRSRVGVGYKILIIGQSQTGIWLRSFERGDIADNALYQTVSVGRWRDQGDTQTDPRIDWVGSEAQDGIVAMAAQLRSYTDAPIMILVDAVEGSGPRELMDDTLNARRTFADLQQPLGRWGNDVSLAALNWITTDWERASAPVYSADDMLQALVLGTGPAWDAIVAHRGGTAGLHHLSEALRSGFGVAVSPGTRASNQDYEPRRSDQIRRAHALGFTVGPPVSDYEIVQGGGPHPTNNREGNRRFGTRLGEAVARALGLSESQNPYFTGATWGATQAEIVVSVALPNGGSLTSPAPAALSGFRVNEGGGWTDTGFTAAISGGAVVLTKDSGTWPAGTRVDHPPGGAQRAGGDAVAEAAIIAGMLYETWPGDTLGTGMPVMGSLQAGQWVPEFEVEVV